MDGFGCTHSALARQFTLTCTPIFAEQSLVMLDQTCSDGKSPKISVREALSKIPLDLVKWLFQAVAKNIEITFTFHIFIVSY